MMITLVMQGWSLLATIMFYRVFRLMERAQAKIVRIFWCSFFWS